MDTAQQTVVLSHAAPRAADTGIIYRIDCDGMFYIGSTVSSLATRAATHRFRANHADEPAYSSRLYRFLKGKKWEISKVSEHPVNHRKELWAIEAAAIQEAINNPNCLNDRNPCGSPEKHRASNRSYYKKNREAICAKAKAKRQAAKAARLAAPTEIPPVEQNGGAGDRDCEGGEAVRVSGDEGSV